MSMTPLSDEDLSHWLRHHRSWVVQHGMLCRTFEAPTFLQGIHFVSQVAKLAETANHHPDIDIRWRQITLRLLTHDAGNRITQLDTQLAQECDLLFAATP